MCFTNKLAYEVIGNICVQGGKNEAVKVFGPFGSVDLFEFFSTSVALSITVDTWVPSDSISVA